MYVQLISIICAVCHIIGSDAGSKHGWMGVELLGWTIIGPAVFDVEVTGYPSRTKSGLAMWTDKCQIMDYSFSTLAPHQYVV